MGLVYYPTLTTSHGTFASHTSLTVKPASGLTLTVGRAAFAYDTDVDLAFLTEAGDYLTAETGDILLTA